MPIVSDDNVCAKLVTSAAAVEKSNSRKRGFFLREQFIMVRKSEPQELEVTSDIASVVKQS